MAERVAGAASDARMRSPLRFVEVECDTLDQLRAILALRYLEDMSYDELAATLGLSLGTVKKHRENLQRKLDCHSAAELARLAIREGLLNV